MGEGKDCDDETIEKLASNLMIIDEAEKDTPRMREIARDLRTKGPKAHQVEVDDKQWAQTKSERQNEAKAKRAEEAAKKMIQKYEHQTLNPKLMQQIEDARTELAHAHETQEALFRETGAEKHDEYKIVDKTKWGPPKKKEAGAQSGTGTTATVAAAAAPAPAPAAAAAAAP